MIAIINNYQPNVSGSRAQNAILAWREKAQKKACKSRLLLIK
jgi:hypothetical protein